MKKIFTLCRLSTLSLSLLLIHGACKEMYVPPVVSVNASYLVVEGFINNGSDTTLITLTRSFKLDDTSQLRPELHAQLDVEGKDNSVYPLVEIGNGQYVAAGLALNTAVTYRLHIQTIDGKEYLSDFLTLKTSPPIDSIAYKLVGGGLQIFANTHDPQNASRYYRWEYQQTWEFHAAYFSIDQYVNHKLVPRSPDSIYTCWQSANSTNILLASTAKLSQDVVSQFPLVLIPNGSEELSVRYSILLKQYALTAEAYNFWSDLQKNSEQIGSIFSPEPFQSRGNIHSLTDTSEVVIGYISAGTMQRQRIFITPADVGNWQTSIDNECKVLSLTTIPDSLEQYLGGGGFLPIEPTPDVMPLGSKEDISTRSCVDCTLRGTNVKPFFWP